MPTRLITTLLLLAVIINACAPAAPSPAPIPTPEPEPFRIIGYVFEGVVVYVLPYDRLTHVNYSFVTPNEDGTLNPLLNPQNLKDLVKQAQAHNVKVLISVGGGVAGMQLTFEKLAANPAKRTALVQGLVAMVADFDLDGVDMDWEYPQAGKTDQDYTALMKELRAALPPEKLLTAAVVAYGKNGDGVSADVFPLVDFLNVMVYDGPEHGTYDYDLKAVDYWSQRGLPKEKMVIGMPFYSRPGYLPYKQIVKSFPEAAQFNEFEYYSSKEYYIGLPGAKQITQLAMDRGSGVMFWLLEQDTLDELSLVKAIYDTAREGK